MNTEALIERLAADVQTVPLHGRVRRLVLGMVVGGAVTMILVVTGLGPRPDLGVAMHGFAFWMKSAYTISLGIGAVVMTARLARPEPVRLARFWPIVVPFALLAAVGAIEIAHVPEGDWPAMWLGQTWGRCPWLILLLSGPIFVGLLWSFRRLAPTRLRATGTAAGLAAGAWAATLYCLHCPEVSAMFVLTWYTLGIVLVAVVGALAGPRLFRW